MLWYGMVWYDMVWCGMGLGHQARGSATRFSVAISVSFRNFFFIFFVSFVQYQTSPFALY